MLEKIPYHIITEQKSIPIPAAHPCTANYRKLSPPPPPPGLNETKVFPLILKLVEKKDTEEGRYEKQALLICSYGLLYFEEVEIVLKCFVIRVTPVIAAVKLLIIEQRHEKTCLRGFRPGPTQTGL